MRSFISGAGTDSTAAVQAHLAAHRELHLADLYVINTAPCYAGKHMGRTFLLTDFPSPLLWAHRGTFKTGVILRGEVASKIGLEADSLQVTWSPQDSDVLATDGSGNTLLSAIEGFGSGVFDNGTVEVWRCVMPTMGDAATLGACLLFSGRIGNIEPDRLKAVITVLSRTEVLNQMIPTNLIEPTNIVAQYTTGQVLAGGPSGFTLASGSTRKILYANPTSAPGGYVPKSGSWDDGYVVMSAPGKLGGSFRGVRSQIYDAGITHHVFYLAEDLPFDPLVGDTFQAFIFVPPDHAGAAAQGSDYLGFEFVPSPLNSSVVIA
jgi:hypothetical protein